MVPPVLGYRHFATEYWQYMNPSIPSLAHQTVKKCSHISGEDITCSMILPSTGINLWHPYCFGRVMSNPFDQFCQPTTVSIL
ncbi:hypothetical protein B0H13DRAFT_2039041 [Mycena leptocephala]|nr:hypothetical protein B0H13DRAFT_2039041 [Mycena leptocephala]